MAEGDTVLALTRTNQCRLALSQQLTTGVWDISTPASAGIVQQIREFNPDVVYHLAAISVGIYKDKCVLDLDYPEDRDASVDANVVMTGSGEFVEVQSSGEEATYSRAQLDELLDLAEKGIGELIELQKSKLT